MNEPFGGERQELFCPIEKLNKFVSAAAKAIRKSCLHSASKETVVSAFSGWEKRPAQTNSSTRLESLWKAPKIKLGGGHPPSDLVSSPFSLRADQKNK